LRLPSKVTLCAYELSISFRDRIRQEFADVGRRDEHQWDAHQSKEHREQTAGIRQWGDVIVA
jgi:hypothetical protein